MERKNEYKELKIVEFEKITQDVGEKRKVEGEEIQETSEEVNPPILKKRRLHQRDIRIFTRNNDDILEQAITESKNDDECGTAQPTKCDTPQPTECGSRGSGRDVCDRSSKIDECGTAQLSECDTAQPTENGKDKCDRASHVDECGTAQPSECDTAQPPESGKDKCGTAQTSGCDTAHPTERGKDEFDSSSQVDECGTTQPTECDTAQSTEFDNRGSAPNDSDDDKTKYGAADCSILVENIFVINNEKKHFPPQ